MAVVAGRLVRSLLFSVTPTDPATVGLAVSVTAALGLVAVLLPARAVTRIDPMEALRHE